MPRKLHQQLLEVLVARDNWEKRQRIWYRMRHDGMARKRRPYPGCADLHFPLIDSQIEKHKPYYFNQAFSTEKLAFFASQNLQAKDATSAAQDFFDYELKVNSNFQEELLSAIDHMLMAGRVGMKVRWDVEENRLCFEAIDPVMLIVPASASRLEEADYFAHVKHISVGAYKRDLRYRQDPEVVQRITGGAEVEDRSGILDERANREGLTYSANKDIVVLWEVYEKTPGGWTIYTYSPQLPGEDLRRPFGIPYKRGGRPLLPFASFQFEIKDRGWYSPRGIAERQAAFESYLSKLWNSKADSMDFISKPLFGSDNELRNTGNIRFQPGEILPGGITPLAMPQPPMAIDLEMDRSRILAEESIMMPDAALSQWQNPGEKATAAEVNYRRNLSVQGMDLRGRVFRLGLSDLYRAAWTILLHHKKDEVAYYTAQSRNVLPPQALHDNYLITPDGTADQWNKQMRSQKSAMRFQMFAGHPNIDQEELVKTVLEDDDSRLIQRLFMPSGMREANEAEDEAMEVLLLMAGFPAAAMPHEDHQLRIRILFGKLQQLNALGVPVDPTARQRLSEHLAQHVKLLQEQNPSMAKEFTSALNEVSGPAPAAEPQPQLKVAQ